MSESATKTSNPSLDVASVVAAEFPRREIERLEGAREPRFQAVIKQSVLEDIHAHGKASPEAEICGVLVGNVFHDSFAPYLLIHASIRGDQAQERAAQVTFKAETWTHIQSVMERDHTDAKIIGWYHTHPGFGIFLSGMDLFIQDNFFNLPWQVAFVYDPSSSEEGLFVWRGGKSERESFLMQRDTDEEIRAKPGYEWKPPNEPAAAPVQATIAIFGPKLWLISAIAFIVSFTIAVAIMYRPWENVPAPATAPIGK